MVRNRLVSASAFFLSSEWPVCAPLRRVLVLPSAWRVGNTASLCPLPTTCWRKEMRKCGCRSGREGGCASGRRSRCASGQQVVNAGPPVMRRPNRNFRSLLVCARCLRLFWWAWSVQSRAWAISSAPNSTPISLELNAMLSRSNRGPIRHSLALVPSASFDIPPSQSRNLAHHCRAPKRSGETRHESTIGMQHGSLRLKYKQGRKGTVQC